MAVQRHDETEVDAPASLVAQAVRAVLHQSPPYHRTNEQGTRFVTSVRPHWWLLGTAMTVDLQPSGTTTRVSVTTCSQWFIVGDVFNFYNRYIHDFLDHLKARLHDQTLR
jgi:hypothetical protein